MTRRRLRSTWSRILCLTHPFAAPYWNSTTTTLVIQLPPKAVSSWAGKWPLSPPWSTRPPVAPLAAARCAQSCPVLIASQAHPWPLLCPCPLMSMICAHVHAQPGLSAVAPRACARAHPWSRPLVAVPQVPAHCLSSSHGAPHLSHTRLLLHLLPDRLVVAKWVHMCPLSRCVAAPTCTCVCAWEMALINVKVGNFVNAQQNYYSALQMVQWPGQRHRPQPLCHSGD
jgi:hypothetical protein